MTAPAQTALPRILLLPGWLGSDADHWQSRWAERFGDRVVEQHDWVTPRRGDWVARLEEAVIDHPGPVALVAHSLGCHLVAAWAQASRHTDRVIAALLVAPPDLGRADLPPQLQPWTRAPARQPLPFASALLASRNDPYCAWAQSERLATDWGAELQDLGALGHVNATSGLGDWPDGRARLDALLRRARAAAPTSP